MQSTWVPDKHPDGVGHQEGVIQRPKKLLVVVPIWNRNVRATLTWSFVFSLPMATGSSASPFLKPSSQAVLGA